MLKCLFGKTTNPKSISLHSVSNILPRQSANELLVGHQIVLNQIEALSGVPRDFYRRYYDPVIDNYACFVQKLPASESHHHALPGGMLQHGLEVAMIALKMRRSYVLPSGASPEEITKKQDRWTYGIFSAALCHDIAKPAVDQLVALYNYEDTEQFWNPWIGPMSESVVGYRTSFRKDRVHGLHEKSGLLLVSRIMPMEGLAWLSEDLSLFHQWMACIGGSHTDAGIIGEIVSGADRESVGKNLGAEFSTLSSQISTIPLHEKLLTGLRQLLNEGELPLNRNGAAGWLIGDSLWLVSKRAIDTLRTHLIAEGHSGIPNRNDRIFDELQQRGILISCNDRAIWRTKVKGDDWEHELTLIRLPTNKIWSDPKSRPESFSGEIIFDEQKSLKIGSETEQFNVDVKTLDRPDSDCNLQKLLPRSRDTKITDKTETRGASREDDPGEQFLLWIQKNIQNGKLPVDVPNSRIYTVPEGFFMVSPAIFKDFIENTNSQFSWGHVQKRFLKIKLHTKTTDGLNVHRLEMKGRVLYGIVLPEMRHACSP